MLGVRSNSPNIRALDATLDIVHFIATRSFIYTIPLVASLFLRSTSKWSVVIMFSNIFLAYFYQYFWFFNCWVQKHNLRCTESFMRENVIEEMRQMQQDGETKRRMLEMLKRVHLEEEMNDAEVDDEFEGWSFILIYIEQQRAPSNEESRGNKEY